MKQVLLSALIGTALTSLSSVSMAQTAGQITTPRDTVPREVVQGTSFKNSRGVEVQVSDLAWNIVVDRAIRAPGTSNSDKLGKKGNFADVAAASEAKVLLGRLGSTDKANQFSSSVKDLPLGAPIVLAAYDPTEARLAVSVFKIERLNAEKIALLEAKFTPQMGTWYQAAKSFIDPTAKRLDSFGVNPFESFVTPTNAATANSNLFFNMTPEGALVIAGMAGKYVGASYVLVTSTDVQVKTRYEITGNSWKKQYTAFTDAWAKPKFYVGTPVGAIPENSAVIATGCAVTGACPSWAFMNSGYSFYEAQGGTYQAAAGTDMVGGSTFAYDIRSDGWTRVANWTRSGDSPQQVATPVLKGLALAGSSFLLDAPAASVGISNTFKLNSVQLSAMNLAKGLINSPIGQAIAELDQSPDKESLTLVNKSRLMKDGSPKQGSSLKQDHREKSMTSMASELRNDPNIGRPTIAAIKANSDSGLNAKGPTNGMPAAVAAVSGLVDAMSSPSSAIELNMAKLVTRAAPATGSLIEKGALSTPTTNGNVGASTF